MSNENKVKKVILYKQIEDVLYELMVQTSAENVKMGDGRMLSAHLAEYLTASEVEAKFAELIGTAPAALDTLGEIAEALRENRDLHDLVAEALTNKVSKEDGKGLSANDFTDELKQRLENLSNYIHPATHSAEMITETPDRNFVTQAEKEKIASAGRILVGATPPMDLQSGDLFLQTIE